MGDMPDSQYSYKLAVETKSGKQYIVEENRFSKADIDAKMKNRMIPLTKDTIQTWGDLKFLKGRAKQDLFQFLDDNWSTGKNKLKTLFKNEDLVKFLNENNMMKSVLNDMEEMYDFQDIDKMLTDYDDIIKNKNLDNLEKMQAIKDRQVDYESDLTTLFDDFINERGQFSENRDLSMENRELSAGNIEKLSTRHWMEDTSIKPGAIKKSQNFEKNLTPKQQKRMKKAFRGKDALVNFL